MASEATPLLPNDFSNIIIVDGLPIVDPTKYSKLSQLLRKLFEVHGGPVVDLFLPQKPDASGTPMNLGYGFVEFARPEDAEKALKDTPPYLDQQTHLKFTPYSEYFAVQAAPEEFKAPKFSDATEVAELNSFLADEEAREQYVLRYGDEMQIFWNDPLRIGGRQVAYGGEKQKDSRTRKVWTNGLTSWSPKGSYLVTLHEQGIVLWGGPLFTERHRFPHLGVQFYQFSPCERFLVTATPAARGDSKCVFIWDIETGEVLRQLSGGYALERRLPWPWFQWSFDGKYMSRIGEGSIGIYESPGFQLLGKEPITVQDVRDVQWSPTAHLLSYWTPEVGSTPGQVTLMKIPSKEPLRSNNLYHVAECKLHWQSDGAYLCVEVSRGKRNSATTFSIFRVTEKDVPIEVIEVTDPVVQVAFEPGGNVFTSLPSLLSSSSTAPLDALNSAVSSSTAPSSRPSSSSSSSSSAAAPVYASRLAITTMNQQQFTVSFYSLAAARPTLEFTVDSRIRPQVFWSSLASHCLIAVLGHEGSLQFWDVPKHELIATRSYPNLNEVAWDQSGRFVATCLTQPLPDQPGPRKTDDNGYSIWTLKGQQVCHIPVKEFFQFSWRVRPPCKLSAEQRLDLVRTFREKYAKAFDKYDEDIRQSQLTGEELERKRMMDAWKVYRVDRLKEYSVESSCRKEMLRDGAASDDEADTSMTETVVKEEMVSEAKEPAEALPPASPTTLQSELTQPAFS